MKKLSICLLFIVCVFITGCGNNEVKEVVSLVDFTNVLESKNFTVNSNMDMYEGYDYILESKKAYYEDIEIEMVKYVDSEYATKAQENQIESFELLKSTGAGEQKKKGKNFYSYVLISNGRYMVTTRVDNTLIFSKVLLEDKDLLEEIINELGY